MSHGEKINMDIMHLRHVVESMNNHERMRTEKLISAANKGALDEEALQAVAQLGSSEAIYFLRHHSGHKLEQAISSLWNMLDVFRCACQGIHREAARFSTLAASDRFWHREKQQEVEDIRNEIRKEIFAASSSAFALVDLSRRVFSKVKVVGLKEKIETEFAKAGDHHLIKGLRNNVSHSWFAPADWRVSTSLVGDQSATFEFDCSQLLRDGDFNKMAQDHIKASGSAIDVVHLFDSYSQKVETLYGWLIAVVDDCLPDSVQEYRECVQAQKAFSSLGWWRVLIEQVGIPKNLDPYDQLDRYLIEDELEEVMTLPHRSKIQVDRIIEFIDEYDACDEDLRAKVYQLFGMLEV